MISKERKQRFRSSVQIVFFFSLYSSVASFSAEQLKIIFTSNFWYFQLAVLVLQKQSVMLGELCFEFPRLDSCSINHRERNSLNLKPLVKLNIIIYIYNIIFFIQLSTVNLILGKIYGTSFINIVKIEREIKELQSIKLNLSAILPFVFSFKLLRPTSFLLDFFFLRTPL